MFDPRPDEGAAPWSVSTESAAPAEPAIPAAPAVEPKPIPLYQRTPVLVGGCLVAVVLVMGFVVYASSQLLATSHHATVHSPWEAMSDVTTSDTPLPTAAAPNPAVTSKSVATTTQSSSTTHQTSRTPIGSTTSLPRPSSAAPAATADDDVTSVAASGHFTGVIAAKNGAVWTITTWDGVPRPVKVTADTKFTGHQNILPQDQFFVGQTVAIQCQVDGTAIVANHIFGLS